MPKDPICGMKGHIKAHGHYFCSQQCIEEYEKKHNIGNKLIRKPIVKVLLYSLIALLLIGLAALLQVTGYMVSFMGIFFVIVSMLKFADWKGFAQAFAMYDVVAKKSKTYAYVYPIIELSLGISFLFKFQLMIVAIITFLIMTIGTVGVAQNILQKNPIRCACLGTKIKIPLTKFTLFEDILMAIMALMILFL